MTLEVLSILNLERLAIECDQEYTTAFHVLYTLSQKDPCAIKFFKNNKLIPDGEEMLASLKLLDEYVGIKPALPVAEPEASVFPVPDLGPAAYSLLADTQEPPLWLSCQPTATDKAKVLQNLATGHLGKLRAPRELEAIHNLVYRSNYTHSRVGILRLILYACTYPEIPDMCLSLATNMAAAMNISTQEPAKQSNAYHFFQKYDSMSKDLQVLLMADSPKIIALRGKAGSGRSSFLDNTSLTSEQLRNTFIFQVSAVSLNSNQKFATKFIDSVYSKLASSFKIIVIIKFMDFIDHSGRVKDGPVLHLLDMTSTHDLRVVFACTPSILSGSLLSPYVPYTRVMDFPEFSDDDIIGAGNLYREDYSHRHNLKMTNGVFDAVLTMSKTLKTAGITRLSQLINLSYRLTSSASLGKYIPVVDKLQVLDRGLGGSDLTVESLKGYIKSKLEYFRELEILQSEEVYVSLANVQAAYSALGGYTAMASSHDYAELKEELAESIIGQSEAIEALCSSIRRLQWGVKQTATCGSFLFVGPTAVGKTELAKQLAKVYFTAGSLVQLDMSEFLERHTLSRLLGSPPGYQGCEEPGQLYTLINVAGEGVLLFDEIEKAHPQVLSILLQLIEEGHVTDHTGRVIDCSKFFVILTSNLGIHELSEQKNIGFTKSASKYSVSDVMAQVRKGLPPEMISRLDSVIVFKSLGYSVFPTLVVKYLKEATSSFSQWGISMEFTDDLIGYISKRGYSEEYGVRYLKHMIDTEVIDVILEKFVAPELTSGGMYKIDYDCGVIVQSLDDSNYGEVTLDSDSTDAQSPNPKFSPDLQSLFDEVGNTYASDINV